MVGHIRYGVVLDRAIKLEKVRLGLEAINDFFDTADVLRAFM